MGKYKTLAKNTGFVFLGTIGSKIINFIMLPLYTRWLVPEAFGAVDTINIYAMFVVGFVCLCIPDAIFIFPRGVDDRKKSEYFSSGITFSIIALSASAILFYVTSKWMNNRGMDNVFSNYPWLIYGIMVTTFAQNYFQSFTRSLDKMLQYSIAGMLLTFSIAVFSIFLIPEFGLYGYAYAQMLANILASLYSFISSRSFRFLTLKNSTVSSVKEMLAYSAPLLPNGIMWWLVDGVNRPVMENFLGLGAIGIYAVAQRFSGLLFSLLSILSLSWINSAIDEYGKPGFEKFYNNYLKLLSTILVVGGIIISSLSRPLVEIFATSDYYDACKYIPILTLGVIFSGMSGTVGGVFSAVKKSKYFFYSSVFGGITSVTALITLTPLFGLMGTVISVGFSFFVMFLARVYYSWRYAKITNIWFYALLFSLYILLVITEIMIISHWRYIVYVLVLAIIVYLSHKEIIQMFKLINDKIHINKING